MVRVLAVIILDSEQVSMKLQEGEIFGTCGVYHVSVWLRSSSGLHTETHVLPLRQSTLRGQVAGDIWRDDRLIWDRKQFDRHFYQQGWAKPCRVQLIRKKKLTALLAVNQLTVNHVHVIMLS